MANEFVSILMGSDSDLPKVKSAVDVLKKLEIKTRVKVLSAHRTPDQVHDFVINSDKEGCAAFICCAGMAAHLAGVVASLTIKPVIGVPIDAGPLNGIDALLSTAQMPPGIPVATVAIGSAGAKNAGFLAAQIIAISNPEIAKKLLATRKENIDTILAKDHAVQQALQNT